MHSEIFLLGRLKNVIAFCSLTALYMMSSHMVEILTLQSPHKYLKKKNLGAISEYARRSQSLPKLKKKKFNPYLGYNDLDMV